MTDRYHSALLALVFTFAMAGHARAQAPAPPAKKEASRRSQTSTQPTPKLLLELANQRRKEAGVPLLRVDEGLAEAARAHARLMVDRQQLSHQFDGEPSLMPRLRESGLRVSWVGENVAYNASAEKAFEALMQSPPHRQNLLDPDFNVAGFAAFWSGDQLYLVQDFAHQLPEIVPASKKQQ